MKTLKITYWITTVLLALLIGMSGFMDITHNPALAAGMHLLGYPDYVMTILGVAKLLAVAALLIPGFRRIKEWAYAGIVFDLLGAIWSHNAVGDHAGSINAAVILLLAIASYITWHRLQTVQQTNTSVS
jgi:uncharacterized membrane protein YphA (DoxX/SURF4 family)